ncbi:uncharacterized protein Aud_000042 [Aspergillus udagawae]|uniref:Uncharacterized protein n=1 Tax=Aspergillus udagawae TaxID=91492 RepID=A0A8E0QH72_9EURO|nr:uncharacterized protein Aud_000042 [Aspergillus udagawae]GIC84228.1 hypothetical protein Aud_000042 [Aspergillus udagawae]
MVDAAFNHQGISQTYFVEGRRYARVRFTPGQNDKITFGPPSIDEHWPSLVSIGFGKVDAVRPVEGTQDEGILLLRNPLCPH